MQFSLLETWEWFKLQTYALQKGNATFKLFFGDNLWMILLKYMSQLDLKTFDEQLCANRNGSDNANVSGWPRVNCSLAFRSVISQLVSARWQQSKQSVLMLECFSRWSECSGRSLEQTCCLYDFLTVAGGFNSFKWKELIWVMLGEQCRAEHIDLLWLEGRGDHAPACQTAAVISEKAAGARGRNGPSDGCAEHASDTSRPPLQIMQHSLH